MSCRRLLLVVVPSVLVLLGMVWGALWLAKPRTAITRENATRIQERMTLAQVDAILGGPARDDSTGPLDHGFDGFHSAEKFHGTWKSDEVIIIVYFDAAKRVIGSSSLPVQRRPDESLINKLRRWLGL